MSGLTEEDREELAPLFRAGYGFTGPHLVEAIVARAVNEALTEAADAVRLAAEHVMADEATPLGYRALLCTGHERAESIVRARAT